MFYIFRNKETGEITEGKYFRNDTIQIINPTNEVLEKYGWEIITDYPVIEELDDYPQVEETDEESEIEEEQMSEIEIESEV
jgi:hypothetical protein